MDLQGDFALINYDGSSLDSLQVFIKSKMTDVFGAAKGCSGRIPAGFREIPVVCMDKAKKYPAHYS